MYQTILLYGTTFIAVIGATIYAYFKYNYTYWEKTNIPHLKPIFPYGNAKDFIHQKESVTIVFKNIYNELQKQSSSFGGFYFFSKPSVMLLDPELFKHILTKDFATFNDRGIFYDEKSDPLSAHLVCLSGPKWKTQRSKITPTFTSGKMKMMFHTVLETSKELKNVFDQHIRDEEPIDIREVFARQATDVISSVAFGLECNSLKDPNAEFRKFGKKIFDSNIRQGIHSVLSTMFPSLVRFLGFAQISPEITKFFMNVLKQTVEYREKNNVQRKDFLDLLIKLKNNQSIDDSTTTQGEGITFNELAAHSFIFFFAGFETTSSTLNFCAYELAVNPDIQERVRQEVLDVVKRYAGVLTYEGIMEMKYMDKVVQEVLRLYPPLAFLQRICTEDYKVPGSDFIFKKGMPVLISTYGVQHDPAYFPDPERFDPERWNEDEKAKRHPYTYLPFGEGPRVCIGMRFALMQVKIVLSALLMDFTFKLHPKTILPIVFSASNPFLQPKDTLYIQAKRIQK